MTKATTWRTTLRGGALAALALSLAVSCQQGDEGLPGDLEDGNAPTWTPTGPSGACNVDALLEPHVYGAKVKAILTGVPLEDAELTQLVADPKSLPSMIDQWLVLPEAEAMLERFFMTAFQQTSADTASFFYLLGRSTSNTGSYSNPRSPSVHEMLNANFSESFARTASELIKQGRPFSEVLTTDTFMMTTAQMVFLAYVDDDVVDDDEKHTVRTTDGDFPTLTIVRDQSAAPPPDQALNPNSANFGKFWQSNLGDLPTSCNVAATQTIDTTKNTAGAWRIANGGVSASYYVVSQMFGRHQALNRHQGDCNTGAANSTPLLDRADFSDWHMVKISKPGSGETATKFYDLPNLRSTNEIKLHTDRVGFFSTPGFHSTWPNNEDNSSRVTINQTLIVALGRSFEGEAVSNFSPTNLDAEHAEPGSECYGCHQTLDPMRDYVRASYTNFYGQQLNGERADLQADFVFGGVQTQGNGLVDLAQTLAEHPDFPRGWAQKLCYWANASACPEGEEFDRVVDAFVSSGLDFRTLVRELFSSPLITGSECVSGVDAGTTATIARRSQFCGQLSHRLGIVDICGLRTHDRDASTLQNDVRKAVASVPDDTFSRAVVEPVTIAETGLFTRANREAACVLAAQRGFDQVFGSMSAAEALDAMVTKMMALPPSDPRHDGALTILQDHVTEVVDGGDDEQVALQSAFVLACMSPGSAGVGF